MSDRPHSAHELAIEYLKLSMKNDQPTPEEFAEQYFQVMSRIEKALADHVPKASTWKY